MTGRKSIKRFTASLDSVYIYKNKLSVCLSSDVMSSCHVVMKLVVVMFVMTMMSLKIFKTFVHGKMFNCKMTEEPTMATTEEAAQRVYAKQLAVIEKVRKESVPRNHKNSKKTGLRLIEKVRRESVPRNYQSNAKPDLLLKEKVKKEGVPRNHKNSKKTGLRLIEKVRKESVPRNHKSNLKIIAWHSGTAQSMIIA